NPTFRKSGNCDVTGNGSCNGQDANAVTRRSLGLSPNPFFGDDAHHGQACQNANPYAPSCTNCGPDAQGTPWYIGDGPNEQVDTLTAFFSALPGDTIEFGPGAFQFDTTLVMSQKEGITVRGQGQGQTILDFLGSHAPEGLSFSHMDGITIEDLTVIDTPG